MIKPLVAALLLGGMMMSMAQDEAVVSEQRAELYKETLRPQFHFTGRYWNHYTLNPQQGQEGWINDVNGLVYYDGEYHLFAQQWGRCWIHAVSRDVLHWEQLPPILLEDAKFGWSASGSAFVDWGNTSGLQTGKEHLLVAFYTGWNPKAQCMAYSNDKGKTWTKYDKNPVLACQNRGSKDDRDPKVFWYEPDQKWIMVLYVPPAYMFFASKDLKAWEKLSEIDGFYECPDMFALPLDGDAKRMKWVLVNGDGAYVVGAFDGVSFTPETERRRMDWGPHFYATQTWSDMPVTDGRRIQIAWMRGGHYPDMPFNQQLTFPCELTLRTVPEGICMFRYPVREIDGLHAGTIVMNDRIVKPGENPLSEAKGDLFDLAVEIDLSKSDCKEIVFDMRGNVVKYTVSTHQLDSCGSCVELKPRSGILQARILVDRMSVETFGNEGEVSITRVARAKEAKPALSFQTLGGNVFIKSLAIHEVKSIWP